jgi:hypothetical protein
MGKKLATDVYVDGVHYAAGEDAPDAVDNPAAFDEAEWRRDSLTDRGPVRFDGTGGDEAAQAVLDEAIAAQPPADDKPAADEPVADKPAATPAGRK